MTNERLFDLVRYARGYLHEAELITDDEFTEILTTDSINSVKRLESYDEVRAKLAALTAERDQLRTALRETREALVGMTPPDGPGWWCPTCREAVDGIHVTYEERHERCGSLVGVADGEPFEIARAVLDRYAGLLEGMNPRTGGDER